MPIIAVIQQKGGVGKSTITANLAGEFLGLRRSVAVLDLDPQKSLATWAQLGKGVLSGVVQAVSIDSPQSFRSAVERAGKSAERVLLDCPPGFPDAGVMAALLADLVLLPVTPSPLDVIALKEALQLMKDAQARRRDKGPLIAFVPSKVIQSTVLGRDIRDSLKKMGETVLPSISQRIAIAEAVLDGLTLREYAPNNEGAQEFRELANAVERMVKK